MRPRTLPKSGGDLGAQVTRFEAKFKHTGQRYDLFVTKFSDIEHYFSNPSHITAVTGISNSESEAIISDALNDFSLLFFDKFRSKREEIRNTLYSDDRGKCPSAIDLVVNQKVGFSQALGKILIKKVAKALQDLHGKQKGDLLQASEYLKDEALASLIAKMPEEAANGGAWPPNLPKERVSG